MENITLIGIDIAKNVFQLVGVTKSGRMILKKKLNRSELLSYIAQLPICTIAMEACGGAHYWAREFQKLGHQVKLMSAKYVKPFVKTNKNDFNDALAITEAASRSSMHFVSVKNIEQHDIQSTHRIRERLIKQRTQLSNQIRGILMEYGTVLPKSIAVLRRGLPELFDTQSTLSKIGKELLRDLYHEFIQLEKHIADYEKRLKAICKNRDDCQRLTKIPGIAHITATYLVALIGNPKHFKNGRHLAAFIGLVPKQNSSGGKQKLLGISKRGNRYLRTLLIHGARAIVTKLGEKTDRQSCWLKNLIQTRGYHKTYVALANKNARVAWRLLSEGSEYQCNLAHGFSG